MIWTNVSEFGCSNGASICSVTFKLTDGEPQEVVFEEIETTNGDRGLVFAAARQQIYMARSGLETSDGLSEEQDIALPFNFYQLTGCLRR
ncbi:hypothetical protein [Pseudorhizobium flavum]|uniref:hypothetical protein n=1 Tax=Pseudorhizobium flavum TaxID=1335061 RepID=UPI00376FA54B